MENAVRWNVQAQEVTPPKYSHKHYLYKWPLAFPILSGYTLTHKAMSSLNPTRFSHATIAGLVLIVETIIIEVTVRGPA